MFNFRVGDGRNKRKKEITRLAAYEPFLGVLAAAADFEWTCRRCILAMSNKPTPEIKFELFEIGAIGMGVEEGWNKLVCKEGCDTIKFSDIFLVWARNNMESYVLWEDVQSAIMLRNRLIHGVEGGIGASEGRKCVNIYECAVDILTSYVKATKGKDIYDKLRRGNMSESVKGRKMEKERIVAAMEAKRKRKDDELIIGGARILKRKIRERLELKGKPSDVENVAAQLRRTFGIELLP